MQRPEVDATLPHEFVVPEEFAGQRLDVFLAAQLRHFSRVQVRRAISAGHVTLDDHGAKPSLRLKTGQRVFVAQVETFAEGPQPEPIPVDVLYEDPHLAGINKPSGMVVHPAKGHWRGTLASALAHHFQSLSQVGGPARPGIVHRLDRDTSGVMVVAKTDAAHQQLAAQFEQRTTTKHYAAIVRGNLDRQRDIIDAPIGPHPYQREKMAIRRSHPQAREARSAYTVVEQFKGFALLDVQPHTGRTHQIRIHLAHIGHPVLCDRLYGGQAEMTMHQLGVEEAGGPGDQVLLARQALHASQLEFSHPVSGQPMQFQAPLPEDLQRLLDCLRQRRP